MYSELRTHFHNELIHIFQWIGHKTNNWLIYIYSILKLKAGVSSPLLEINLWKLCYITIRKVIRCWVLFSFIFAGSLTTKSFCVLFDVCSFAFLEFERRLCNKYKIDSGPSSEFHFYLNWHTMSMCVCVHFNGFELKMIHINISKSCEANNSGVISICSFFGLRIEVCSTSYFEVIASTTIEQYGFQRFCFIIFVGCMAELCSSLVEKVNFPIYLKVNHHRLCAIAVKMVWCGGDTYVEIVYQPEGRRKIGSGVYVYKA